MIFQLIIFLQKSTFLRNSSPTFGYDPKFAVIESGMTIQEALEGALIFNYVKADQILEMEDEYTGELIIIELVKITKTEMVFRSYESGIGFELYFKKC
jgi:hypothetical protein